MPSHTEWYEEKGYFKGYPLMLPDGKDDNGDWIYPPEGEGTEVLPLGLMGEDGAILREVVIGKLTGLHEDILGNRALQKTGRAINFMLAGGSIPGVKEKVPGLLISLNGESVNESIVGKLAAGDRSYILQRARLLSYPGHPNHSFRVKCQFCPQTYNWSKDLREMMVWGVPEGLEGKEEWECELPECKKKVIFKVVRGKDEKAIQTIKRKFSGSSRRADGLTSGFLTELMRWQIISIEGRSRVTNTELRAMSAWDRTFFRNEAMRVAGGVETELASTCPECDGETLSELPLNMDFFFPGWI